MAEDQKTTVERMARLARLDLDAAEIEELGSQLTSILSAFESLSQLDTGTAEPMSAPARLRDDATRPDTPREGLPIDTVLGAAPDRRGDFYGVPKTIQGERA